MVLEAGKITDQEVRRLRERIGTFNRPRQYGVGLFNEYASRDAIRHFCQGIGDPNLLYWDEEYARHTRYGSIIAPPAFLYSVYWCSGRTGGLPGVHGFHAGNDWEWFRPIHLGDRISVQEQFTGLDEKSSQFAGRILIQSSVCHYYNQRGETIARCRGWQVRAERAAASERRKYTFEPYRYTRAEIQAIEEAVLSEEVRGNAPRWWEEVEVGEELQAGGQRPPEPRRHPGFCSRLHWRPVPRAPAERGTTPPLLGLRGPQHGRSGGHHTSA